MKIKTINFLVLIAVLLSPLTAQSQRRYLDRLNGSKVDIGSGTLICNKKMNIFINKSRVAATMDSEKIYSKALEVKLPKNILYYRVTNQSKFEFYYSKNQVIYLDTDFLNKNTIEDTVYAPSQDEVYNLINFDEYSNSDAGEFLLTKITYNKKRKTTIVKKGDAVILLYNIIPKNHKTFFTLVNQFKFLN